MDDKVLITCGSERVMGEYHLMQVRMINLITLMIQILLV